MRLYYSADYVLAAHSFDTTRKAGWITDSLRVDPIASVELVAPEPLAVEQLVEVHAPEYVEALRTGEPRHLATSQGFTWDPGLWTMVCATNGGAVAAALAAMQEGVAGSLSSGLHHARRDRGAGFCSLNGLVLAAKAALAAGADKVLIVDYDAHAGGGTASLIESDPRIAQIDLTVSPFDTYEVNGSGRLMLDVLPFDYTGSYALRCIAMLESGLATLKATGFVPDLVLYNAGMDPFEGCGVGGRPGITAEELALREKLVFAHLRKAGIPAAFVLAGGYLGPSLDQAGLVQLHRYTIEAAARSTR